MPSVRWHCWLGGTNGIRPVKTEWWDTGVIVISCSRKISRIDYLSGASLPKVVVVVVVRMSELYTVSHKKRSQLIFVCNFVKNQWILMQFSLLELTMDDTCDGMNFTHLT